MDILLKTENISKRFSESFVNVNDKINFDLIKNEMHAIVGENGSGKSTFMHIVSGLIKPDNGNIFFKGEKVVFNSPRDALLKKIGMVHQIPGVVPGFSIFDNIILGNEGRYLKKIDRKKAAEKIEEIKFFLGIDFDIYKSPESVEAQQLTVLLSLIYRDIELIIFDEPASALNNSESNFFYSILDKLRNSGKTVIIVTHKIEAALEKSDRITVLTKGCSKGTYTRSETDLNKIVDLITGEEKLFPREKEKRKKKPAGTEIVFEGKNIIFPGNRNKQNKNILNFYVKKGEILSFTGIRDKNLDMLENLLSGFFKPESGEFLFLGKNITGLPIRNLRRSGIKYIPSDRFTRGTSLATSVEDNLAFTHIRDFTEKGFLQRNRIKDFFIKGAKSFNIKAKLGQPLWQLSGGNIQKIILFREMYKAENLLIFCEPSINLDIKSRDMIYESIFQLRSRGTSIIIISTDMEEVIYLSDKVAVMHEGNIAEFLEGNNINSYNIGRLALGITLAQKLYLNNEDKN